MVGDAKEFEDMIAEKGSDEVGDSPKLWLKMPRRPTLLWKRLSNWRIYLQRMVLKKYQNP